MNTEYSINLTQDEYKRLIDLLFLGDFVKNSDYLPKNYEDLINRPDHKLLQKIFKAADTFDCQNLFEQPEPDLPLVPKNSDDIIEKYIDL